MKHALLALVACSLALAVACSGPRAAPTATLAPAPTPTPMPAAPASGTIVLPGDEGVHLTPLEWWYFNGHLEDSEGREYSFHFVTFLTVTPDGQVPRLLQLGWADHQENVYLSGEKASLTLEQERSTNRFGFQVEGWRMTGDGSDYRLDFNIGGYALELEAAARKPAALHQGAGLVDLGATGMTYYYSRPRLSIKGVMDRNGAAKQVSGWAWMDHQWGDFSVAPVGWDWAGIQLDDGSELMISVVWNAEDGAPIDTYGTYVPAAEPGVGAAAGAAPSIHLPGDGIRWSPTGAWTSEATGIEYPQGWHLAVDSLGLDLVLLPKVKHAEFASQDYVPVVYWEGAVTARGKSGGKEISGQGFVELVGYDDDPPGGARSPGR